MPDRKFYLAPLSPGEGVFEYGTGRCLWYSVGGHWFYDIETNELAFYMVEGVPYRSDGTLANLQIDVEERWCSTAADAPSR